MANTTEDLMEGFNLQYCVIFNVLKEYCIPKEEEEEKDLAGTL
jgi:hypothetical protein